MFDTDGLIGGNEVFKDSQAGGRWQQPSLEVLSGPLKGTHLALYPFLLTTWGEWRQPHRCLSGVLDSSDPGGDRA